MRDFVICYSLLDAIILLSTLCTKMKLSFAKTRCSEKAMHTCRGAENRYGESQILYISFSSLYLLFFSPFLFLSLCSSLLLRSHSSGMDDSDYLNDSEEMALEETWRDRGSRCKREAEHPYMQVVLKANIRGAGDGVKATQAARIETQHEDWIGR